MMTEIIIIIIIISNAFYLFYFSVYSIDGETAKMHLPFGLLLFLGIQFTKQGVVSFL